MEIDRTIGKILQGYQPACVVITANELKIFDELKQPVTSKQVAKNRNLDPEACARLLNALTSLCLLYTSPSPRDKRQSRMPSSA